MNTAKLNYTTINHVVRLELGLTANEYMVADLVYNLASNPSSPSPTWCFASKSKLGELLGLSEKSIHVILNKLEQVGLIEKHPQTKHLKITVDWYNAVVINTEVTTATLKKVQPVAEESSVQTLKKVQSPIYYKDIYKDNYKRESSISFLTDLTPETIQEFTTKYKCSESQLISKALELVNYCKMHGKKYKDYHALLDNALRKDFGLRPPEEERKHVVFDDDGGFHYEQD